MTADVLPLDLPPAATPRPTVGTAPTRAYESDHGTVYLGRAEHVLPLLPSESVGLVATDPPYGIDYQSNRRTEQLAKIDGDTADTEDRAIIREVMREAVRVVGQQRHIYAFGPADVLDGLKVSDVVPLVWDKATMGGGNVRSPWGPQHEQINFTVSKHRHAGKAGLPVLPTRMRKGSVIEVPRPTGRNVRHPNEKPVNLMRELIESSSRQGEVVLDPFGGILSTAVAAILTGRRFLIIEKRPEYVEVGIERIRAAERLAEQVAGI